MEEESHFTADIDRRKHIRIDNGLFLSLTPKCTKLCPVCHGNIIEGLYHIAIRNHHMREESPYTKKGIYSAGVIYMHITCAKRLGVIIKDSIKSNQKTIKNQISSECIRKI